MASFLDRVRYVGDWDTDGGSIPALALDTALRMYASGAISAAYIKSLFTCTTAQATQLDAILATRPASPLLLLNVPAYVQWVDKVSTILQAAQTGWSGYDTDAAVKTALGI